MTDQQQQLCQSSERLVKLFLDESVTNKSISLQLWFNRAGKLQFRLSTASSRRENRRTTASTDEEPVSAANKPPPRAPTRPQPTVTTRSISAANKKQKTAPTISPTPDEPSPEIPRCASQQNQHNLSFLDTNRKDSPVKRRAAMRWKSPRYRRMRVFIQDRFLTKNSFRHSPHHQYLRSML